MWSACSAPGLKELITRAFRGKFRLGSSSSFGRKSQSSPHHACVTFWLMSTQDGEMADEEKLSRCKISTDNVYKTLKTHTKYAYIVRGRPTLKDFERFRNGSFRESYKISLYERTFIGEPFIEKHAISTELSNVNREKHRCKSHHVCRREREPSRIPIRSLKF